MRTTLSISLMLPLLLTACAGSGRSEWDSIDYSRIARENRGHDLDTGYTAPTGIGCEGEYICD